MRAIDAGIHCLSKGHYPFIPHLTHFVEQRAQEIGVGIDYEDYLEWDEQFLDKCDSFLYLEPSAGADQEFEVARELGLTIYYDCTEIRKANETRNEDNYQ